MRPWRRRQPQPEPGPALGRTLDDAEVHQAALGVLLAAAAGSEENVRLLLAGLNAADLTEITGDVAAFGVSAFRVLGWEPERVTRAFGHLALLQALQAE